MCVLKNRKGDGKVIGSACFLNHQFLNYQITLTSPYTKSWTPEEWNMLKRNGIPDGHYLQIEKWPIIQNTEGTTIWKPSIIPNPYSPWTVQQKPWSLLVFCSQKNRRKWIKIGTLRKANSPLWKWVSGVSWKPELSSICVGDVATQLSGSEWKILGWPWCTLSLISKRELWKESDVELERVRAPCEAKKNCLKSLSWNTVTVA